MRAGLCCDVEVGHTHVGDLQKGSRELAWMCKSRNGYGNRVGPLLPLQWYSECDNDEMLERLALRRQRTLVLV